MLTAEAQALIDQLETPFHPSVEQLRRRPMKAVRRPCRTFDQLAQTVPAPFMFVDEVAFRWRCAPGTVRALARKHGLPRFYVWATACHEENEGPKIPRLRLAFDESVVEQGLALRKKATWTKSATT